MQTMQTMQTIQPRRYFLHNLYSTAEYTHHGLIEVRRKFIHDEYLRDPVYFNTVEEFYAYSNSLYNLINSIQTAPGHWNPDQVWVSQWFDISTLFAWEYKEEDITSAEVKLAALHNKHYTSLRMGNPIENNYRVLLAHLIQIHTQKVDQMRAAKARGELTYTISKKQPKLLILDQNGRLQGLHFNIETGEMCITPSHIGYSLYELGIQVQAIYVRECGEYYKVV